MMEKTFLSFFLTISESSIEGQLTGPFEDSFQLQQKVASTFLMCEVTANTLKTFLKRVNYLVTITWFLRIAVLSASSANSNRDFKGEAT